MPAQDITASQPGAPRHQRADRRWRADSRRGHQPAGNNRARGGRDVPSPSEPSLAFRRWHVFGDLGRGPRELLHPRRQRAGPRLCLYEDEPGRRMAIKRLTRDEGAARNWEWPERMSVNLAGARSDFAKSDGGFYACRSRLIRICHNPCLLRLLMGKYPSMFRRSLVTNLQMVRSVCPEPRLYG